MTVYRRSPLHQSGHMARNITCGTCRPQARSRHQGNRHDRHSSLALRRGDTLRDGRAIPPDGMTLIHGGPLGMCISGLHASRHIIDALIYAPGQTVCRVRCGGRVVESEDKLICTERTILWRLDATDILRATARRVALDVIHLWDAPDVVRRYLETGDESIRAPAWDATATATRAAAWDTSRDAARATSRGTARDAARDAARSATWPGTLGAARAAVRDAAQDAALDAALDAAVLLDAATWTATRYAVEAAAEAAVWAVQDLALTALVDEAHRVRIGAGSE